MNETEQMQCRQTMRLIMIYSENVALARRKLEQMLFCRNSMEEKKNEKNEKPMMILVWQAYWEKMKKWCW